MTRSSQKPLHSLRDHADSEAVLRRVLVALGPYRKDLILIGGWVPYLYQRFGGFPEWQMEIARTVELDLVIPSPLASEERPPLAKILGDAGFSPISGNEGAIWIRDGADDEMIEFFTAHEGTARQMGKPRQISGQTALAAISLTQLPLLTEQIRILAIGADVGDATLTVRVPTLGGYILNKALTFTERLSTSDDGVLKAAKDIVYMRDVMAGGENVRAQVRSDIKLLVKGNKSRLGLVKTAGERVRQLKVGTSRVLDVAVSQLEVQHRLTSDSGARADLIGYIELLADLLGEIRQKRGRHR